MSPDEYLQNILVREAVDTGVHSPVRGVQATLQPIIQGWAGTVLSSITPSGSFAKGPPTKVALTSTSSFLFRAIHPRR